jgi:hypothetical protein
MFEALLNKLSGTDALIRAMRGASPEKFAEVFARSVVLFLQVTPGFEDGFDTKISQEELLANIRAGVNDLSKRKEFTPLCRVGDGRRSLLLFTRRNLVGEFVQAYSSQVKRLVQIQAHAVNGKKAGGLLNSVDAVVFNALTKHEYDVPAEQFVSLKQFLPTN